MKKKIIESCATLFLKSINYASMLQILSKYAKLRLFLHFFPDIPRSNRMQKGMRRRKCIVNKKVINNKKVIIIDF